MKFYIRDLLWLTLVVALGLGWWLERSRLLTAWEAADLENRKYAAAYRDAAIAMSQIDEELLKRGVTVSQVKGKIVVGPESAFAP